ncbi:hypothetical protein, partial [Citrobacter freundii]|uniref:hypothetical protein n=1 Tax=Citrobacter freundii TaxID=546 RepID=UPI00374E787E
RCGTHQGASILAHLTPDRLKQTFLSSKFVLAKMGVTIDCIRCGCGNSRYGSPSIGQPGHL